MAAGKSGHLDDVVNGFGHRFLQIVMKSGKKPLSYLTLKSPDSQMTGVVNKMPF
jgi:hypothetical protein